MIGSPHHKEEKVEQDLDIHSCLMSETYEIQKVRIPISQHIYKMPVQAGWLKGRELRPGMNDEKT